jgi:hypothetical protein
MICRTCSELIEPERLEVLPNTVMCSACAHKYNFVKPRKGIMVFSHKTGGELEVMSESFYNENKKYFIPNGARSAVKNFSRNVCA